MGGKTIRMQKARQSLPGVVMGPFRVVGYRYDLFLNLSGNKMEIL